MKDIIRYTDEEAVMLGRTLTRLGVPSFGPQTGMQLLKVVEGVDKLLKENSRLTEQMKAVLGGYRNRLLDVCAVAGGQQGEVIKTLEDAIKGGRK